MNDDPYSQFSDAAAPPPHPSGHHEVTADPYAQIDADPTLSPDTKQQLIAALKADPTQTGARDANGRLIVDIGGAPAGTGSDQYPGSGVGDTPPAKTAEPGIVSQLGTGLGAGARDIAGGAGQLLNVATSPIRAGLSALGLPGGDADYEHVADHIADQLGLAKTGHVQQAIQRGIVSGLLTAGVAAPLAAAAPVGSTTAAVANSLADAPLVQAASSGASAGSGEVAKESGAGELVQLAASVLGGGLTAAGGIGASSAIGKASASATPSELLAAFQRQNVQPLADQVGGTAARSASGVVRATLGGIPLAEAAEKSIAGAKAARDRIASTIGRVADDTGAGQAAQRGANQFISQSEAKAGELYDAIPIPPTKLASLDNTRSALADLTQGLDSNPELSKLVAENPRLRGYLDALTPKDVRVEQTLPGGGKAQPFTAKQGGELSWQDLKRFRSIIGQIAGQPTLAQDTAQQSFRRLYAALSDDIRATAQVDSPKSLAAFNRANSFYRARQGRIDNVLTHILGNDFTKSPEGAFQQIQRWSRDGGDSARVAQALRSLPDDEANSVRASLFSRLGNVPAGRQDISGEVFSPNDFATQWNKLDPRAKSVLFPGEDYRRNIDDIARIADSMKRSQKFANTSLTAHAGNGIALITLALAGHPVEAGGVAATQYTLGKLLASPRFANWLASSARKPNAPAALAHINRLTAVAAAEPTIANEVLHLQQRLAGAFTDQARLAASPEQHGDNGRNRNGQQ